MKNSLIVKVLSITAVLFSCCCFMSFYNAGGASKTVFAERNRGESAIVIERDSGRILFAENAFDKKFMASTTKIVTAITVIENCNLDEVVTVKKETVGIEGSSIYLEEGEKLLGRLFRLERADLKQPLLEISARFDKEKRQKIVEQQQTAYKKVEHKNGVATVRGTWCLR